MNAASGSDGIVIMWHNIDIQNSISIKVFWPNGHKALISEQSEKDNLE